MKPSFGELFGAPISSYFALLALGFALATWIVWRWARRNGVAAGSVYDLALVSAVGGIVGGRLLHVVADGYFWDYVHLCTDPAQVSHRITRTECSALPGSWDAMREVCHPLTRDCLAWAKFYNGGLALYGGFALALLGVLWLVRRDRLPRAIFDVGSVALCVGLACGRMGCFLAGCCHGTPTLSALGVRFPSGSPASQAQYRTGLLAHPSLPSLPVHATQLYEAAACAALALLLTLSLARRRFDGQVALVGLLGYAALRFALEFVRGDERGSLAGLSTSQWIGGVLALAGAALWRHWSHSHPRA